MSRVGKMPIQIPDKVTLTVQQGVVEVKGPNGSLRITLPELIRVAVEDGQAVVARDSDDKKWRAQQGLVRNLVNNMVVGVSDGFRKILEINGVGYRAEVKGKELHLSLGFSHPVIFPIPDGISVTVNKQTGLTLEGRDKQLLGETAARIRRLRPPEPYKGKGIKYADEVIKRKAGKTAA